MVRKKKIDPKKITHRNMPASVGLVTEVRDELRAEIRQVRHEMNSKFLGVDSKFEGLESKFDEVLAVSHRTQALMEEQRSENRIVLDGLKNVNERMDRFEAEYRRPQF